MDPTSFSSYRGGLALENLANLVCHPKSAPVFFCTWVFYSHYCFRRGGAAYKPKTACGRRPVVPYYECAAAEVFARVRTLSAHRARIETGAAGYVLVYEKHKDKSPGIGGKIISELSCFVGPRPAKRHVAFEDCRESPSVLFMMF